MLLSIRNAPYFCSLVLVMVCLKGHVYLDALYDYGILMCESRWSATTGVDCATERQLGFHSEAYWSSLRVSILFAIV
jgi:hypothetical protein